MQGKNYIFEPYKTAGRDGITPMMLQKTANYIMPTLVNTCRECLNLNYLPKAWREVNVIFIPKAGKCSHTIAKDYILWKDYLIFKYVVT